MKYMLPLIATVALIGCTPEKEAPLYEKLSALLADNPASDPADRAYFIERYSEILDEWDNVVLVYGYPNDRSACDVLVKLIRNEEPNFDWRCSPAN